MRNVHVSEDLFAALTEAAAREGISVNELAVEILCTVVGGEEPPARPALSLQAQILTVLLKEGELGMVELVQETGRENDDRGYDQVRKATAALVKRGLVMTRSTEAKVKLYSLRK